MLAAAVLITGVSVVVARYIKKSAEENGVGAAEFYFSSDMLTTSGAEYNVSASSVTVTLLNNTDELHITGSDLTYAVTVTNGTASSSAGTIPGGFAGSQSITVTPTDDSQPVVVTAATSEPYVKTLTATFTFDSLLSDATYLIEDNEGSDYATLKIMAGSADIPANSLSIQWNTEDAALDPTNQYLLGNSGLNSGTLTIEGAVPAHNTAVIYIFKKDISEDYSVSETAIDGTITIA